MAKFCTCFCPVSCILVLIGCGLSFLSRKVVYNQLEKYDEREYMTDLNVLKNMIDEFMNINLLCLKLN